MASAIKSDALTWYLPSHLCWQKSFVRSLNHVLTLLISQRSAREMPTFQILQKRTDTNSAPALILPLAQNLTLIQRQLLNRQHKIFERLCNNKPKSIVNDLPPSLPHLTKPPLSQGFNVHPKQKIKIYNQLLNLQKLKYFRYPFVSLLPVILR